MDLLYTELKTENLSDVMLDKSVRYDGRLCIDMLVYVLNMLIKISLEF